jgi:hypothetical protein
MHEVIIILISNHISLIVEFKAYKYLHMLIIM